YSVLLALSNCAQPVPPHPKLLDHLTQPPPRHPAFAQLVDERGKLARVARTRLPPARAARGDRFERALTRDPAKRLCPAARASDDLVEQLVEAADRHTQRDARCSELTPVMLDVLARRNDEQRLGPARDKIGRAHV